MELNYCQNCNNEGLVFVQRIKDLYPYVFSCTCSFSKCSYPKYSHALLTEYKFYSHPGVKDRPIITPSIVIPDNIDTW